MEADRREPFQSELAERGVERIAQHLGFGFEQIRIGDDIDAGMHQRHAAGRADVGEVKIVREVGLGEILGDRVRARNVFSADIALKHRSAGRADGGADLVHEGRPGRGIENHIAEARGHIVKPVQIDQNSAPPMQTALFCQAKQAAPRCARYRA
ncbi:hypothetical protein ACVIHH_006827 [Bradyrhizobium sp. USDA 4518]